MSGLVASSADSRGSWSCCANVSRIRVSAAHTDTSTTNSLSRKIPQGQAQGQNHAHHLQWEQDGASSGRSGQVPHTDVANFVHFHCFSLKFVASCGSLVAHGTVTFEQLMLCPRGHISTLFFHTANICIQVFTAHTAVSGAEACKMM